MVTPDFSLLDFCIGRVVPHPKFRGSRMLCSDLKASSLLLFPTSPYCNSLVRLTRTFATSPTEHLIRTNDQHEIHPPPRRHDGALRERIPRRTQPQRRKEQVFEEQEGQASSGSVSVDINLWESRIFANVFHRIGKKVCKHGKDESGHCIRT